MHLGGAERVYNETLVAKSIRLLIKHKGKPWLLAESEIGEISFSEA